MKSKEGTAVISGRVTIKDEPAPGVMVALQSQPSFGSQNQQSPGLRTKTDGNGNFHLTGIPAGNYVINAVAPGMVSSAENQYGLPGKTVNVSDGENIEGVEFKLKRGGVITGRVTTADGRPMIEQTISLQMVVEGNQRSVPIQINRNFYMHRTDDRGIYRLYGVPAGRYRVSVGVDQSDGSFAMGGGRTYYARTYHPDVTDESQAKVIELGEGEEVTGVDISFGEAKKTYDVFGRVFDEETGQPVIGIGLSYGTLDPNRGGIMNWGSMGARSGAQGEFHLSSVIPGKYGVFAMGDEKSVFYSDPVPFEVTNGDVKGIEVSVKRGGSVSGVVVIEGTSDPAVLAKLPQIVIGASSRSGNNNFIPQRATAIKVTPDGSFRLLGLRPGKVQFYLQPIQGDRKFIVLRAERGGAPQPEGIELGPGEQLNNVRVIIGYANAVIRGQVKIVGGVLPESVLLRAFVTRPDPARSSGAMSMGASAEVDVRGQFVLQGLMPGQYEVRLMPMFRTQPKDGEQRLRLKLSQLKQMINIGPGETQATFTIDLGQEENK